MAVLKVQTWFNKLQHIQQMGIEFQLIGIFTEVRMTSQSMLVSAQSPLVGHQGWIQDFTRGGHDSLAPDWSVSISALPPFTNRLIILI